MALLTGGLNKEQIGDKLNALIAQFGLYRGIIKKAKTSRFSKQA